MSEPEAHAALPPEEHARRRRERHQHVHHHAQRSLFAVAALVVLDAVWLWLRLFFCWDASAGKATDAVCGGSFVLPTGALLLGVLSALLLLHELVTLSLELGGAERSRLGHAWRGMKSLDTAWHRAAPVLALALLTAGTVAQTWITTQFEVLFPRKDALGHALMGVPLLLGCAIAASVVTVLLFAQHLRWPDLALRDRRVLLAWVIGFWLAVGALFWVAGWTLVSAGTTTDALLKLFAAAAALGWFMTKAFSGQLHPNLALELTAARDGDFAILSLTLEKRDRGAIELCDVVFLGAADGKGEPRLLPLDARARISELHLDPAGRPLRSAGGDGERTHSATGNVVLVPGEKTSFAWRVPITADIRIVDTVITARRHPFHFLWFFPQWRGSAPLR